MNEKIDRLEKKFDKMLGLLTRIADSLDQSVKDEQIHEKTYRYLIAEQKELLEAISWNIAHKL